MVVGVNDIEQRIFKKLSLIEILEFAYSQNQFVPVYWFPTEEESSDFLRLKKKGQYDFYKRNGNIPFFYKDGSIAYESFEEKLEQAHLNVIPLGDNKTSLITLVELDEELYVKLVPNNKLYMVAALRSEMFLEKKI